MADDVRTSEAPKGNLEIALNPEAALEKPKTVAQEESTPETIPPTPEELVRVESEKWRRHYQSEKDKELAAWRFEQERVRKEAEEERRLQEELDRMETADDSELAETYRTKVLTEKQRRDKEASAAQYAQQYTQQVLVNLQEEIIGFVPDQKRQDEIRQMANSGQIKTVKDFLNLVVDEAIKTGVSKKLPEIVSTTREAATKELTAKRVAGIAPETGTGLPLTSDSVKRSSSDLIAMGFEEELKKRKR